MIHYSACSHSILCRIQTLRVQIIENQRIKHHIVLKRRNSCLFPIKLRDPLRDKREEIDFDLDCRANVSGIESLDFDRVKTLPDSPTRLTIISGKLQIFDGTEVMLQAFYPRNIAFESNGI